MPKKKKQEEVAYYSLDRIDSEGAQYNVIFGMRSNGKSFAAEKKGLEQYLATGEQMCIIRRYDMDLQGARGQAVFTHFVSNPKYGNMILQMTNGKWDDIYYYGRKWYLCTRNDKGVMIKDVRPFCFGFALAGMEHDKSTSYPDITTVIFDEFLTRDRYLVDEFIVFTNVLSTIIRNRDNVKIYMLGNTVNKYSPYFKEMGLDRIDKMHPGDIQLYQYAGYKDKTLKIAVEYADNPNQNGKPSDIYFAFNNPKLKMITNGMWELALYPHLPYKYRRADILMEFYIKWEGYIMHCEVIDLGFQENEGQVQFIYIHMKTTEIKEDDENIIYSTEYNPNSKYRRRINRMGDKVDRLIWQFFVKEKVFYQDNEVGELVRNYIQWCQSDRGFV